MNDLGISLSVCVSHIYVHLKVIFRSFQLFVLIPVQLAWVHVIWVNTGVCEDTFQQKGQALSTAARSSIVLSSGMLTGTEMAFRWARSDANLSWVNLFFHCFIKGCTITSVAAPPPHPASFTECWIRPHSLSSNTDPMTPGGLQQQDLWPFVSLRLTYNVLHWSEPFTVLVTGVQVDSGGSFQWFLSYKLFVGQQKPSILKLMFSPVIAHGFSESRV